MAKRVKDARAVQWLWTRVMLAFMAAAGLVPLPLSRVSGRGLGRMAFVLLRGRRRTALRNVDLAYGDSISVAEKRRIALGAFENFGIVAMEFPHTPKAGTAKIVRVVGRDRLDESQGGLFLSAHAANWEWLAPTCAAHGLPVAEVVNTYTDSRRGELLDTTRRAGGVITIPKDAAASTISKLLSEKTYVGILIDQSARKNAVPTTFFGQTCWTTTGPAMLALRSGLPVYLALMHREPDGEYVLELSEKIPCEKTKDFRGDIARFSQRIQDMLEIHVRKYPDQWMWMHDRWKDRSQNKMQRWTKPGATGQASGEPAGESPAATEAE